jgi:hypothetical protein
MTRVRRQPDYILGGSITRAPNGYRAIIQTSMATSSPMVVQEVYSNASQRRYPRKWDAIEPTGKQVIYLTDVFEIVCGKCSDSFGGFAAYFSDVGRQWGLVQDTARHYYEIGRFPPDNFKNRPNDRFDPAEKRYWLTGDEGLGKDPAWAHFRCLHCGVTYERNFRRLGKQLYKERPGRHTLRA